MREIVLDTETTGLDPADGHRIVEIGAVELHNHMPTRRTYHQFINPERPMPKEAFDIHGLGDSFLVDKPVFASVAQGFLDFIAGDTLIIHNAAFDLKFLNHELRRANLSPLAATRAVDTVQIARARFPGSPASLDALCRRFGIDNSRREKHGALLDSEILAEVYLELIGGRQPDLTLQAEPVAGPAMTGQPAAWRPRPRNPALPSRLTDDERLAHDAFVSAMGGSAIWNARS